jgi:hypothetical protein
VLTALLVPGRRSTAPVGSEAATPAVEKRESVPAWRPEPAPAYAYIRT